MGSDEAFKRKIGVSSSSSSLSPRKWVSRLLSDELSLETVAETTYVKLNQNEMDSYNEGFDDDQEGVKGGRATAWRWLKPASWNGRETTRVQLGPLAKCKSHNAWGWLQGRAPSHEFQFDPSKRWPQGW